MRLSPQTSRRLKRFRSIRRGYGSFLVLCLFAVFALTAELLVSNRALVVSYGGRLHFPTYGAIHTGREFGYAFEYEVDYRELARRVRSDGSGNWVLLPLVPYGPNEDCYPGETFKPRAPDFGRRHFFGTDQVNRDVLARLLYGFRNSLIFATGYVALTYLIGISIGCAMG